MINISKLLNKKSWTGEEVGKALVASLIHDIKHQSEPDYKLLFTQSDFERMERSISTDRDRTAYGVYRDLYNGIIFIFNKGQGLYQQFSNGFYRHLSTLREVMRGEDILRNESKNPLIMTQMQYDRIRADIIQRKKAYKENYKDLFFTLLQHFLEAEDTPAEIEATIEATEKEAVTNKRIIENYINDRKAGYHTLPDGRRSDNMSKEEWITAVEKEFLQTHKLIINEKPAPAKETIQHYTEQNLLSVLEFFFKGVDFVKEKTGKELTLSGIEDIVGEIRFNPISPRIDKEINNLIDSASVTEWHIAEPSTINLTKLDILYNLLARYKGTNNTRLLNGETVDEVSEQTAFEEFKADYPEVYKAVATYIEEHIPQAKELKEAQHCEPFISWEELAELDIPTYQNVEQVDDFAFSEYYRIEETDTLETYLKREQILLTGIAILQAPYPTQIDSKGDYKETSHPLQYFGTLESLYLDSFRKTELELFKNSLLIPALEYLYAYNGLIDILSSVFDIDGMEIAKLDITPLEAQCSAFNRQIYLGYNTIYGDGQTKKRKREMFKEIFKPINIAELKPSEKALEAVKEDISEDGLTQLTRRKLKDLENYLNYLMGKGAL